MPHLWKFHPLHFHMQTFSPVTTAPGYPCSEGHDIHIFHMQVQASQGFIAYELSFTGLFRILAIFY